MPAAPSPIRFTQVVTIRSSEAIEAGNSRQLYLRVMMNMILHVSAGEGDPIAIR